MASSGKALKRARTGAEAPAALDLLDEAAHLLRRLPAAAAAVYFAGTVPMVVGTLFFVAEMARGAQARAHAAVAALGLVLLFTWMKAAQAVAAEYALATLEQRRPAVPGVLGWCRLATQQLRVHAFGLALLPLAAVLALPFGWAYAFYQNATVLGVPAPRRLSQLSWKQARLWPAQNHALLGVLLLLGLFVFLNLAIATYSVPWLLRTLLGLDNVFATSGWNFFNTTFLAVAGGLTYLALDPLLKATYVLRCFHGHARHTGADLLVRVRSYVARPLAAAIGCMLATLAASHSGALRAADVPAPADSAVEMQGATSGASPQLDDATLDGALDRVLDSPDYAWRLPRPPGEKSDQGLLGGFVQSINDAVRWVRRRVEDFLRWLLQPGTDRHSSGGWTGLGAAMDVLVPVLIALVVLGLLWLAWRWWGASRVPVAAPRAPVATSVLEDDAVTADQLPEEEWLQLARDLLARGEVRLALRAFFLGSLAGLAGRGLLVLARHKSNRDYERELARRGGASDISTAFRDNRHILEGVWYGRNAAGPDDVRRFEDNVRAVLGGGAP